MKINRILSCYLKCLLNLNPEVIKRTKKATYSNYFLVFFLGMHCHKIIKKWALDCKKKSETIEFITWLVNLII